MASQGRDASRRITRAGDRPRNRRPRRSRPCCRSRRILAQGNRNNFRGAADSHSPRRDRAGRARTNHHHRHRSSHLRRALTGNFTPVCRYSRYSTLLLRLHQPHRGVRLHRHEQGLPRRALRQGFSRLHQLPNVERRVRRILRSSPLRTFRRRKRLGEAQLFRELPAH